MYRLAMQFIKTHRAIIVQTDVKAAKFYDKVDWLSIKQSQLFIKKYR